MHLSICHPFCFTRQRWETRSSRTDYSHAWLIFAWLVRWEDGSVSTTESVVRFANIVESDWVDFVSKFSFFECKTMRTLSREYWVLIVGQKLKLESGAHWPVSVHSLALSPGSGTVHIVITWISRHHCCEFASLLPIARHDGSVSRAAGIYVYCTHPMCIVRRNCNTGTHFKSGTLWTQKL